MSSPANAEVPGAPGSPGSNIPLDSRIPERLSPALGAYVDALHEAFPERVYALSLYGSLALGGFVERTSDIDFLTVMVGQISEDDQLVIKALHQRLRRVDRWASRLDGEYAELDQIEAGELDAPCLFVADGSLAGRHEVSKAGWLTLVQCGISVIGPEPAAFIPDVPWVDLEQEMAYNLDAYWAPKAASHWLFLHPAWVMSTVLSLSQVLYTLDTRGMASKQAAAKYASDMVPAEYSRLIDEALRLRAGEDGHSLYRNRIERALATRRFILAVVRLCHERHLELPLVSLLD